MAGPVTVSAYKVNKLLTSLTKTGTGTLGGALGKTGGLGGGLGKKTEVKKVELPAELQDKTVKDALEMFEKELDSQVREFQTQARQIARWDREIFECIALMQHLESQIQTVEGAQRELQQQIIGLLKDQETFIKTLNEEKGKATEMESSDQRQKLYNLARELSNEFLSMEGKLQDIKETSQSAQDASNDTAAVTKIEKIANCHLDAMRWIEHQSNALEDKIKQLSQKLDMV